jgi:hypothetical protein
MYLLHIIIVNNKSGEIIISPIKCAVTAFHFLTMLFVVLLEHENGEMGLSDILFWFNVRL